MAVAAALVLTVYAAAISRDGAIRGAQVAALQDMLFNLRSELASARAQTAALEGVIAERVRLERALMAPDLELVKLAPAGPAPGARAVVMVSRGARTAVIRAEDLPPTSAGKTYELWWITKKAGPVPAGLFQAVAGREAIAPAVLPPAGQRVTLCAVTLEPAGGVSKPTGAIYLKGAPPGA